jgi:pyruvate,water dikinase
MSEAGKIWVVDDEPSARYPIYTRGNVGEVFPEAVAPLSWTLGGRAGAEPGWRDAFEEFGAFDRDEFPDAMDLLGCFGGYAYLNVSISRIFAVRTPGMTPEVMDQTLFGTSDAPPYAPRPGDESPVHTERIQRTLNWVMTADALPELTEDQRMVDQARAERGDVSERSDQELVDTARVRMGLFRQLFARHILVSYGATVPVGVISQVCAELGDPCLAMRLVAGLGDVDSAAPSWAMWDLGRRVAASRELTACFDAGVDGLYDRLRPDPGADGFLTAFHRFVEAFGSRGPNEWEMRSPTWETDPELALAAIERMRLAPEGADPAHHWKERAADREAATAQVTEALVGNPEVQRQFVAAVHAAGVFLPGRERSKTTIIKLVHEARLHMHELGRRMAARGHFEQVMDFGMLRADELDQAVADPGSLTDEIRRRDELFRRLQALEPPFILEGSVPPLSQWRRRGSTPVEVATPGTVLSGIPGCPGSYQGTARVVLSPHEPGRLCPGDVLVAPITDPAWTPLFVPAGAVVVDVGAQISHAVIVARELGIPCVVSVTDATRRIPDGATVSVDGTAGTVTVG